MTKTRGVVHWKKVKKSYGTYSYPQISLPDVDDSVKKMLEEQDEIILDLSRPFAKKKNRR